MSLLARFGVLSIAALALLAGVLGFMIKRQIEARAMSEAEEVAVLIARAAVQPNVTPADLSGKLSSERVAELDRRLQVGVFADTGIQRVKIFNATKEIVYSDKREIIGDSGAGSSSVDRALRGEIISHFVHGLDHTDKGARSLEVYVPLRFKGGASAPVGVYEVYLSYAATEEAIAADTRTMFIVIAAGLLLVWALLFRIVSMASRRLRRQATHDALTGLPNRVLLEDRIERALANTERRDEEVAVLFIDLDRFKEINDTLGHAYGDELLRQVALRLDEVIRNGDTLARLGGDEFAVLLPSVSGRDAVEPVADRLRDALHRSFTAGGTTLDVEASIGVAISPDGTTAEDLLASADIAMYSAKERKAGAVFFNPEDRVNTPTRLNVLGDLRRALEADDQLSLHFQPKYALDDERLIGVEALLRWSHPERGNIPPAEFIELAEGTGIIHQVTERVLREALAQSRRWLDAGHRVAIAVNLSTRCLLDTSLPDLVGTLLAEAGVPPQLLRLEITESAVMSDPARAAEVLRRLHELGTSLSVDDFGTGYTSMAYLRRLPVDELKVDRSFVMNMTVNEHDAALVRTAIDLGHNLGLTVVAEGVEDASHVSALRALDCDVAQGYHYARPMPAAELTALLGRLPQPV